MAENSPSMTYASTNLASGVGARRKVIAVAIEQRTVLNASDPIICYSAARRTVSGQDNGIWCSYSSSGDTSRCGSDNGGNGSAESHCKYRYLQRRCMSKDSNVCVCVCAYVPLFAAIHVRLVVLLHT